MTYNLENLIDNVKPFFPIIIVITIGVSWLLGSPLTFAWLISKDAQIYHSYYKWIYLILIDGLIALFWPLYWFIEIIESIF